MNHLNQNNKNNQSKDIRLNKFLSEAGVCSRREADKLIEKGRIKVNSSIAAIGQKITENDRVFLNEVEVTLNKKKVILAFNKPKGLVCTTAEFDKRNIIDYLGLDYRVFPIGRLDKDSEGLLLLTNNGEIVNKVLKSVNGHEKEYIVRVNKKITDEFLLSMSSGIHIIDYEKNIDTVTKPCKCKKIDEYTFSLVLTQGINRQIRRMCTAFNYDVKSLKRIRIMNIRLDRLKTGDYRKLSDKEISTLLRMLKTSKL